MIHRFIGKFPIQEKQFWIADKEFSHQVRDVLRLAPGDRIILCDGMGLEADVELLNYDKNAVEVKTFSAVEGYREPKTKVILYLAILKKENFELAVQKAVEAGVYKIVPVITKRTVKLGVKRNRLEKIIKEAAEQSGRTILPTVEDELDFKKAVAEAKLNDKNFFFALDAKPLSAMAGERGKTLGAFVGPEGGWDEFEMEYAKGAKFVMAGLGKLTFRAETAAIIAVHDIIFALEK